MRHTNLPPLTGLGCISLILSLSIGSTGCTDDAPGLDDEVGGTDETAGDGDPGDGDGDPGDGDGDPGDGDGDPGDGDGDPGDGDGDPGDGDGDPASVCGDGVIEAGEDCEAEDLAGMSCASLGFLEGELSCGGDCQFDTSACSEPVCGDGMAAGTEACDLDDFSEQTCETLGFSGGALACLDDCTIDDSGCYDAECGNDVLEPPEECDGADLGGQSCADFGFVGGELTCDACTISTDGCSMCGNDEIDDGESCDGLALAEQSCVSLGYVGGELACAADCGGFDESGCYNWWGDDFEAGAPLGAEWALTGSGNWFANTVMPHAGLYAAQSGLISHSQQTHMEVTLSFVQAGTVTFWRRVSSEQGWDYLRFAIDGVQQGQWSGSIDWTEQSYPVSAGLHTLRWSYTKDDSVDAGADRAWIDDITTVNAILP